MFENLMVTSGATEDHLEVNLSWKWKYENGAPLPSCTVFCCTIPESQLLRDTIFTQDEIIQWINRQMFDISSPQNRISNIEAYYNNPANQNKCWINKYQLNSGGGIFFVQQMRFPVTDINKVFLVCVYGEKSFEPKVFAIDPDKKIEYDLTQPSLFDKLAKKNYQTLSFKDAGDKRRVIVSSFDNEKVYSVLPGGSTYYLDKEFDKNQINDVVYLSSLIGN